MKLDLVLIVDGREKKEVKDAFFTGIKKHELLIENLGVGDYWICKKISSTVTPKQEGVAAETKSDEIVETKPDEIVSRGLEVLFIIERKTWSDFISSLESKEKHIHHQRGRMLQLKQIKCGFLVEGGYNKQVGKFKRRERERVQTFLVNAQHRDDLFVHYTLDIAESVRFFQKRMDKMQDSLFLTKKNGGVSVEDCFKVDKKSTSTPKTIYIASLAQHRNVSTQMAKAIVLQYPTLIALCAAIQSNAKKVIQTIATLKSPQSDPEKKGRVFGYKRAKEFVESLCGATPHSKTNDIIVNEIKKKKKM